MDGSEAEQLLGGSPGGLAFGEARPKVSQRTSASLIWARVPGDASRGGGVWRGGAECCACTAAGVSLRGAASLGGRRPAPGACPFPLFGRVRAVTEPG